ncbi:MAG: hypothetical protein IM638_18240 [Bacteroidetes bacterium]|nr:hypothetical protein [Bacteroidota bacterium]
MELFVSLLSFSGGLLGAGLMAYFSEKGKSKAIKEDLAKMTQVVEGIKSGYSKENEELKAQLSLLVNKQNSLHADLKRAVFEFGDSIFIVLSLCDSTRPELAEDRFLELTQYKRQIEHAETELTLKHARFCFLVEDNELIDLADKLHRDVTRFSSKFSLFIIRAEPYLETLAKVYNDSNFNEKLYKEYWNKVLEIEAQMNKEVEEFEDDIDDNLELFKKEALRMLNR